MKQQLSEQHIAAVNRRRRVVVNFDSIHAEPAFTDVDIEQLVKLSFTFADDEGSQIDSIWWNWSEGHEGPYPSKVLQLFDHPGYKKWVEDGVDIMKIFLEETKKRGLEVFHSYRINGGDHDLGAVSRIAMKEAHPEWLIYPSWRPVGMWNFAFQGVRDYKLRILREVAEDYDFDGLELDYARGCPVLPPGHQWENREKLTDFMRAVRSMTLEVEEGRGRPFLLAARVPENLEGCHFDGLDVETWAREELLDIFVIGIRSFDVDVAAFRRITAGKNMKLFPCLDDHHTSDGYNWPPIEVLHGVFASWWRQGVDGVYTFNWNYAPHEEALRIGLAGAPHYPAPGPAHRQLYREIGSPQTLERKDKTFVVQRRGGGGHGPSVPVPEDWTTPRGKYFNTNMFAPLPAGLANDGKADTLLTVYVGDDVANDAARIRSITLGVLLSDPAAEGLPEDERIERTAIRIWRGRDYLYNLPPSKGIEDRIELRLNNALLGRPTVDQGWLVFAAQPDQFAVGSNLVGLRVTERPPETREEISVEKLEVQVQYR